MVGTYLSDKINRDLFTNTSDLFTNPIIKYLKTKKKTYAVRFQVGTFDPGTIRRYQPITGTRDT